MQTNTPPWAKLVVIQVHSLHLFKSTNGCKDFNPNTLKSSIALREGHFEGPEVKPRRKCNCCHRLIKSISLIADANAYQSSSKKEHTDVRREIQVHHKTALFQDFHSLEVYKNSYKYICSLNLTCKSCSPPFYCST